MKRFVFVFAAIVAVVALILTTLVKPQVTEAAGETHMSEWDQEFFQILNDHRVSSGLAPVTWRSQLQEKSLEWATELSLRNISPYDNGHDPDLIANSRSAGCNAGTFGEIVYMNTSPYAHVTPQQAFDRYMTSPTHRSVIEAHEARFGASGTIQNSANRIFNVFRFAENCNQAYDSIIVPSNHSYNSSNYRLTMVGLVYGEFTKGNSPTVSINITRPNGEVLSWNAIRKQTAGFNRGYYEYHYLDTEPIDGTYTISTPGVNSVTSTFEVDVASSFLPAHVPTAITSPVGTPASIEYTLTPSLGRPVVLEHKVGGEWVTHSTHSATADYGVRYIDPKTVYEMPSPTTASTGTYRLRAPAFAYGDEVVSPEFTVSFTKATAAQTVLVTEKAEYSGYSGTSALVNFEMRPGYSRSYTLQRESAPGTWVNAGSGVAVNGENSINIPFNTPAGSVKYRISFADAPNVGDAVNSAPFVLNTVLRPTSTTLPGNLSLYLWQSVPTAWNNVELNDLSGATGSASKSSTWTLRHKRPGASNDVVVGTGSVDPHGKFVGLNLDELDMFDAGNHVITLNYNGNADYASSSSVLTVNSQRANTTAVLSVPTPHAVPTAANVEATIKLNTNSPGTMDVQVQERVGTGAWTTIHTMNDVNGPVVNNKFNLPSRAAGSYSYRLVVSGGSYFAPVTSPEVTITRQMKVTNVTGWLSNGDIQVDTPSVLTNVGITWSEGRPYRVESRRVGTGAWSTISEGYTPSGANAQMAITVLTSTWRVGDLYDVRLVLPEHGQATAYTSKSARLSVTKRKNPITVSAPSTTPAGGTFDVSIRSGAMPKSYTQRWEVQERIGTTWSDVASGTLTFGPAAKTQKVSTPAGYTGSKTYRVVLRGTSTVEEVVSPTFVVRMVKGNPIVDASEWVKFTQRVKDKASRRTITLAAHSGAWRFERRNPSTGKWKVVKKGKVGNKTTKVFYNVKPYKQKGKVRYRFIVEGSNMVNGYSKAITVKTARQKSSIKKFKTGKVKVKPNKTYSNKKVVLSHKAILQERQGKKWVKVRTYKKGTRNIKIKAGKKGVNTKYRLLIKRTKKVAKTVTKTLTIRAR